MLPDPWTSPEFADCESREMRLRDLRCGGDISEWRRAAWADCKSCGGDCVFSPCDDEGRLYDGAPVVCAECGHAMTMGADLGRWWVSSRKDADGTWAHLRPTALAGFRRLLGIGAKLDDDEWSEEEWLDHVANESHAAAWEGVDDGGDDV